MTSYEDILNISSTGWHNVVWSTQLFPPKMNTNKSFKVIWMLVCLINVQKPDVWEVEEVVYPKIDKP